ncbi:MAG: polysaccharide deacetylase [Bacilli bacterium]|nr:polysaccharide deacetylase [Bacilli bacterium]
MRGDVVTLLVVIIFILFLIYGPLPTLLARLFQWHAIRAVNHSRDIFLTFDDGPNPDYTPQILKVLREYGVKATFFLVAGRALRHPELVKRIVEDGHEIGSHGERHHALWFKGWRHTQTELSTSYQILRDLTGAERFWYRPPWGLLNWAALTSPVLRGRDVVLWSVMPSDWRKQNDAESIANFAIRKVKGGSIIVLHDSDESLGAAPGAPLASIAALPQIISSLQQQGFEFRTVSEVPVMKPHLSPFKIMIQSIWMGWEHIFEWFTRIRSVSSFRWGIFKVFITKHHGRSIACNDGTSIQSGDWVGELHLDNQIILQLLRQEGSDRVALTLSRMVRDALIEMSKAIDTTPELAKVKAFTGITLLHRGIRGLGFELHQLKSNWFRNFSMLYLRFLLRVFHPHGKKRVSHSRQKLVPMMLVMTRESLLNRRPVEIKKGEVM